MSRALDTRHAATVHVEVMSDSKDIVARLRAYTQHDRPVLSSDLKTAADEIAQLRAQLISRTEAATTAVDDLERFTDSIAKAVGINANAGRRNIVAAVHAALNSHENFVQGVMVAAGFPDKSKPHTADDLRKIVDGVGDLCDALTAVRQHEDEACRDRDMNGERLSIAEENAKVYQNLMRRVFHGVAAALGISAPPINTDTIDDLVRKVKSVHDNHEYITKTFDSFVRGILLAAGLEPSHDDMSMEGFGRITERVKNLRYGRDHARAEWTRLDAEARTVEAHRPGFVPITTEDRFDEIDRRLALLESSARRTAQRFENVRSACSAMAEWGVSPTMPVALKNIKAAIDRSEENGNG